MAIVKGTKENFKEEVLEAKGVVVVDFGANWCGYRRTRRISSSI